jgi:hypothetical protein
MTAPPLSYYDRQLLTIGGTIHMSALAMQGDTGSGGIGGFVPPPKPGDYSLGAYLDAGGGWSTPGLGAQWLFAMMWG